jgi:hypothetical protein
LSSSRSKAKIKKKEKQLNFLQWQIDVYSIG